MNTTEFLMISAAIVPDRTAVIFEDRRVTFEEMQARANRLSNALADAGVVSGDRVAILEVNTDRYVEAYFATAKLDAIFVPLNFRARADELSYMINDATPKVVLAGPRYEDLVKSFSGDVECVDHYISLEGEVDGWLSYESITDAASEDEMMFPEAGDDDISVLMYHLAGMQAVISAIYGGRTLIIQRQFEPEEWMTLVETERADRAMMVPTMLKMLMEHENFSSHDLSSLKVITYGAASMPLEVIKRAIAEFPGTSFINAFGATETAATITMLPPEDHMLTGTEEEVEKILKRLSSIGKPLDDVEVRILGEDGEPMPVGEVGDIVARGGRVMKGYWNMEEATAETIRGGWLFTGDLGYEDEDGYIFLSGRAKDFIKRGGEMISPEEVEQVLQSHPAIDEAAIIGIPDLDWGERVRAIVVAKAGVVVDEADVIEFCRQRLASYKKPESVVVTSELPRNPLGKVLKTTLREQFDAPITG